MKGGVVLMGLFRWGNEKNTLLQMYDERIDKTQGFQLQCLKPKT